MMEKMPDGLTERERAAREAFFHWQERGYKNAWQAIAAALDKDQDTMAEPPQESQP